MNPCSGEYSSPDEIPPLRPLYEEWGGRAEVGSWETNIRFSMNCLFNFHYPFRFAVCLEENSQGTLGSWMTTSFMTACDAVWCHVLSIRYHNAAIGTVGLRDDVGRLHLEEEQPRNSYQTFQDVQNLFHDDYEEGIEIVVVPISGGGSLNHQRGKQSISSGLTPSKKKVKLV
jgi:hypothetical protein